MPVKSSASIRNSSLFGEDVLSSIFVNIMAVLVGKNMLWFNQFKYFVFFEVSREHNIASRTAIDSAI